VADVRDLAVGARARGGEARDQEIGDLTSGLSDRNTTTMLDFVRKNFGLVSAALDAMPEKVLVLDDSGRIVLANASSRTLFASDPWRTDAFRPGKTLRHLAILNPDDEDTTDFLVNLDRVLAGRASACTHVCRSTGTGSARWYRLHAARVHLGRWTGVLVTIDDVSDVHQAKQAINRLFLRLNRLQEQERERIALELHDSTAQHLAAASLNLAGLRARVSLSGRDAVMLDDIERSLQSALHEVKVMSFALYPPRLDEDGLNATLERFVRTYTRQTGIRTALHAPPLDSLPLKLRQALLRITQEALSNVHRHAAAARASVRLRITRESVLLCVADDGRGMDRARRANVATTGTGIGISGMRARVDQLGGVLRVRSRPGRGTRVLAQIPLPRVSSGSELRTLLPSWLHAGAGHRKRREARIIAARVS
jgi:signal transduction histidine kinase